MLDYFYIITNTNSSLHFEIKLHSTHLSNNRSKPSSIISSSSEWYSESTSDSESRTASAKVKWDLLFDFGMVIHRYEMKMARKLRA